MTTKNQNIYIITKQNKLKTMVDKYSNTLVIVVYIRPDCLICERIVKPFESLSNKYKEYIFAFIDVYNYDQLNCEYYQIDTAPYFIIFYNKVPISQIVGCYVNLLGVLLKLFTEKLINTRIFRNSSENHPQTLAKVNYENLDTKNQKILLLKQLFLLTKSGVQLSNSYSMKSDLDEIIWEYNLHTNPDGLCVNSTYLPLNADTSNSPIVNQKKQESQISNTNVNLDMLNYLKNMMSMGVHSSNQESYTDDDDDDDANQTSDNVDYTSELNN